MPSVTLRDVVMVGLRPRGAYSLSLGTCLGAGVWVTFVGGIIMFRNLPRQQFGNVQRKLFPAYFTLTSSLSALLLGLQLHLHPLPSSVFANLSSNVVILPASLSAMLFSSLANLLIVGPWTSRLMIDRHKKEREEGKSYSDTGISEEMKKLNHTFGIAHGVSSLLNLGFLLPTVFVAAWVGQHGI